MRENKKLKKFIVSDEEYNHVFQVAHGVLEQLTHVEKSCIFFSIFGSYILNKHYKIPATPVAGAFGLCVNDTHRVAFFGRVENDKVVANSNGFHMWIQTEHHIVDFMAPIFPITFALQLHGEKMPSKILQKLKTSEVSGPDALKKPGDFITYPDPELTDALINRFLGKQQNTDLLMIAESWFGKPQVKAKKEISIVNDLGKTYQLKLPKLYAVESW